MGESDEASSEPERQTLWQRMVMRRLYRLAGRRRGEALSEEDWVTVFEMHASRRGRMVERVWKSLPGSPRCGMCGAPFSRPGSLLAGPLGYRPSRKNPHVCSMCVEGSPPGGATIEAGIMFADVRGFTARSESADPRETSRLLSRLYSVAEESLFPEAIIDKLIGDEVMALYLPFIEQAIDGSVPELMLEHARRFLAGVGYRPGEKPFVELGIGLDYGQAFVGNIGDRAVYDFTAVGDVVNTAARLQGAAGPGEIVLSERVASRLPSTPGEPVELELKGKASPVQAYRIGASARTGV